MSKNQIYVILLNFTTCLYMFTLASSSNLRITHNISIPYSGSMKNLRILYRYYEPQSLEYVYVAGQNFIKQLTAKTIEVVSTRVIGPKNFSIFCLTVGESCEECADLERSSLPFGYNPDFCGPRPTDNYVKAWATSTVTEYNIPIPFDYPLWEFEEKPVNDDRIARENALYVCYNVYHGYCQRLHLTDINREAPWSATEKHTSVDQSSTNFENIPVVGSLPNTHSVLVVGSKYVYVATEPDGLQDHTLITYDPLTARLRNFQFASQNPVLESSVKLSGNPNFPLHYKSAFRYIPLNLDIQAHLPRLAYMYFILQQPESHALLRWQPRIARVCDGDKYFLSYVELSMACKDCLTSEHEQKTFNALHLSARGTVGMHLSQQLKDVFSDEYSNNKSRLISTDHSEVVLVAFAAQPVDPSYYQVSVQFNSQINPINTVSRHHESKMIILSGSAIALFSMAQINAKFDRVIRKCLDGEGGMIGPTHFLRQPSARENVRCVRDEDSKSEAYCPSRTLLNHFITGHAPEDDLEAPAFLFLHSNVTSMAVTTVSNEFTVALFTTEDGYLLKYELQSRTSARSLAAVQLTPMGQPLTDIALDITGTVAYITSFQKIYRVELYNCASYHTCKDCLSAHDPYCGWCVAEGRCLLFHLCPLADHFVNYDSSNRSVKSDTKIHNYAYRNNKQTSTGSSEGKDTFSTNLAWLSYKNPIEMCPIIKQVSPPGVRCCSDSLPVKKEDDLLQQTIILSLDSLLSQNLLFSIPTESTLNRQTNVHSSTVMDFPPHHSRVAYPNVNSRLVCSFRLAPDSIMSLDDLIMGTLSNNEISRLLFNVQRTPPLATTSAKLLPSAEKNAEVHCLSPPISKLPTPDSDKASLPIILWLEKQTVDSDENSAVVDALAPALFAVYSCSRLSNCLSCARSRFVCAWCLLEDRCVSVTPTLSFHGQQFDSICYVNSTHTDKVDEYKKHGGISTKLVSAGRAIDCPRFKSDRKVITLPSGSSITVPFRVYNLQKEISGFTCAESCTSQRFQAVYYPNNSTVLCKLEMINLIEKLNAHHIPNNSLEYSDSRETAMNCSLNLFWHESSVSTTKGHRLINEDGVKVEVYSCEWLANYCDECLDLPARFGCGWCSTTIGTDESSHCHTRTSCLQVLPSHSQSNKLLQPGDICPNPQILSLTPLNGTLNGQSVLKVIGRNLGRNVTDLIGNVYLDYINPIKCELLPHTYIRSREFSCRLAVMDGPLSLPVSSKLKVNIRSKYHAFSPEFTFMLPQLEHISPERGPQSGGTRLHLTGKNLNIGSHRSIYLYQVTDNTANQASDSNIRVKCEIDYESDTLITCLTGPLPNSVTDAVVRGNEMLFITEPHPEQLNKKLKEIVEVGHFPLSIILMHDMSQIYPTQPFTFIYSPNPIVHEVERHNVLVGGGTTIRVRGQFLFVINDPRVVFYFNNHQYSFSCAYLSGHLECLSPSLLHAENDGKVASLRDNLQNIHTTQYRLSNNDKGEEKSTLELETFYSGSLDATLTTKELLDPERLMTINNLLYLKRIMSIPHLSSWPIDIPYGFIMDNVKTLLVHGVIRVHQNPIVTPFSDGVRIENLDELSAGAENSDSIYKPVSPDNSFSTAEPIVAVNQLRMKQLIRIYGQFDALTSGAELIKPDELQVRFDDKLICEVNSVINTEIRCDLDRKALSTEREYHVQIKFGKFLVYRPGSVRFVALSQTALRNQLMMIIGGLFLIFLFIGFIGFTIWYRLTQRQQHYQARLDKKYAEHEKRVIRVFREDFMELQTSMQEFSQEVKKHNLPYRDYRTFCLFTLFPEYHCELMLPMNPHSVIPCPSTSLSQNEEPSANGISTAAPPHPLLSPFTVPMRAHDDATKGISLLHALLCDRQFLHLFIHLMDEDDAITAKDKSHMASLLCAALHSKMDYLTDVMFDLMSDFLFRLQSQGDNRLLTAFRRAETVVDKILSNWLSFLLYRFIKSNVGENLFYFYRALLQQINMGPRDAVTGKARYTLDSATLLQTELTGKQITLIVEDPQRLFAFCTPYISVKVLDCDTITQTKEKILDAIYKNKPYSKQLKPTQLDLKKEECPPEIMYDWDMKFRSDPALSESNQPPYRLNCISDYQVKDNTRVALVLCHLDDALTSKPSQSNLGPTILDALENKQNTNEISIDHVSTSVLPCHHQQRPSNMNRAFCHRTLTDSVQYSAMISQNSLLNQLQLDPNKSRKMSPDIDLTFNFRPTGLPNSNLWYHLQYTPNTVESSFFHIPNQNPCTSGSVKLVCNKKPYVNANLQSLLSTCTTANKSHPECNYTQQDSNNNINIKLPSMLFNDGCSGRGCCNKTPAATDEWLSTNSRLYCTSIHTPVDHTNSLHYPLIATNDTHIPTGNLAIFDHCVFKPHRNRSRSLFWKKKAAHKDRIKRAAHVTNNLDTMTATADNTNLGIKKVALTQTSISLDRPAETLPKEVFFNRLLLTRLSVTKYMDKLFEVIFSSVIQSHSLPAPIKYLFDFLDDRAMKLGVQDSKIIHAWKSNCLQMRFWNQVLTNLDYIFDIPLLRNTAFERSFYAFSQAMTYACTPTKERITKDSSCVKLLFAPDIGQQWGRVHDYYREIKALPAVKHEEMEDLMRQHSRAHSREFNVSWAIFELYMKYVGPYQDILIKRLQQDAINCSHPYMALSPVQTDTGQEYPGWNPMQIIQMLHEIKRCFDNVQSVQSTFGSMSKTNLIGSPFSPMPNTDTPCTSRTPQPRPDHFHSTMSEMANLLYASSEPSQVATDCLDTVHSYDTLATEFAPEEMNTAGHHYLSSLSSQCIAVNPN